MLHRATVTTKILYSKMPSAMEQLWQQLLTFAGHCYKCEDQRVKHRTLRDDEAGKMLGGQSDCITYVNHFRHPI